MSEKDLFSSDEQDVIASRSDLSRTAIQSERRARDWDEQYKAGYWRCSAAVDEVPHYAVTLGFLLYTRANGVVLDVGCGEGEFLNYLQACGYRKYLGIDISVEAISNNMPRVNVNTQFVAVDVELFTPIEEFDAIIFSECLYYFHDPVSVIRRYARALRRNGVFIVSLYLDQMSL